MMPPAQPKIYHIVHVDRLPSIIKDGYLWCDAKIVQNNTFGTTIGMRKIKQRRLTECKLRSYPDLYVGECTPFYFCPRSVMLYLIHRANHPDLAFKDGQEPIIHLEADLYEAVTWARQNNKRWAITLSNASTKYFEDRSDLKHLEEINWAAVDARKWNEHNLQDGKQAEFLIENCFPWDLVKRIGVHSDNIYKQVIKDIFHIQEPPLIQIKQDWYY